MCRSRFTEERIVGRATSRQSALRLRPFWVHLGERHFSWLLPADRGDIKGVNKSRHA